MNIITEIHLILDAKLTVKVFSQDITDDVDKRIERAGFVHSVQEFDSACYEVAEEFRISWEDRHDLSGRTFARTKIRV